VVPRDEGDDVQLIRFKAAKAAVTDEVFGVPVVILVADMDTHVMEQAGIFEPLALLVGLAVKLARLVEDGEGEAGHLPRMLRGVVAALGEFDNAAPADIRNAFDLPDVGAVLLDVVEHEAFAQCEIAERDRVGVQIAQERIEQHDARDGKIGAPRIEARHFETLVERL
jgi:hypothetical protein